MAKLNLWTQNEVDKVLHEAVRLMNRMAGLTKADAIMQIQKLHLMPAQHKTMGTIRNTLLKRDSDFRKRFEAELQKACAIDGRVGTQTSMLAAAAKAAKVAKVAEAPKIGLPNQPKEFVPHASDAWPAGALHIQQVPPINPVQGPTVNYQPHQIKTKLSNDIEASVELLVESVVEDFRGKLRDQLDNMVQLELSAYIARLQALLKK